MLGNRIYRDMVQQDTTLAMLRASNDPLRRLVYRHVVKSLGSEPEEEQASLPLRRLPEAMKEKVERGFVEGVRLYRDRQVILRAVDSLWVRHLTDLSALREGIGLRAFGQQNPLVAYQKEAHEMYRALLGRIQSHVARSLYLVPKDALPPARRQPRLRAFRPGVPAGARPARRPRQAPAASGPPTHKLGRNDPCWCGSGKKYKNCHMRQDQEAQAGATVSARPPQTPSRRRRRRR